MPRTPLEAYAFDARLGKRSVFILDPRLLFEGLIFQEGPIFGGAYLQREICVYKSVGLAL